MAVHAGDGVENPDGCCSSACDCTCLGVPLPGGVCTAVVELASFSDTCWFEGCAQVELFQGFLYCTYLH